MLQRRYSLKQNRKKVIASLEEDQILSCLRKRVRIDLHFECEATS
jgi:hypothetical protein